MTIEQRIKNLSVPEGKIDVVLDTDAYNEIDDQFAIAYLLRSKEKLNTVAMYAAPFHNSNSNGPEDGMEKSYDELQKILSLAGETDVPTFRGSRTYLTDEKTPVISDAAQDLAGPDELLLAGHLVERLGPHARGKLGGRRDGVAIVEGKRLLVERLERQLHGHLTRPSRPRCRRRRA